MMKLIDDSDRKTKRYTKYTEEELLKFLRQYYEEKGRVPTIRDFMNNPKYPGSTTYRNYFGTWDKAIKMAGLCASHGGFQYTDEELLEYIRQCYKEIERVPTLKDFAKDPKYPSLTAYTAHFGTWNKALRAALDIDEMIKSGTLQSNHHKGRLFELILSESFIGEYIDLSGDSWRNPFDAICQGKICDAKSAAFNIEREGWSYVLKNRYREDIEYFYIGAFNEDYTELEYSWKVQGENIDTEHLWIGLYGNRGGKFNIENMKEYEITRDMRNLLKRLE